VPEESSEFLHDVAAALYLQRRLSPITWPFSTNYDGMMMSAPEWKVRFFTISRDLQEFIQSKRGTEKRCARIPVEVGIKNPAKVAALLQFSPPGPETPRRVGKR